MKNLNNKLNLKTGKALLIVELKEGITVAIPSTPKLMNAKILEVFDDGSFTAHWKDNYNLDGDFRTELMKFDNDLVFDNGDKARRNEIRRNNGLIEIN